MFSFPGLYLIAALLVSSGAAASASSILYGGLEDYPGTTAIEQTGDFNDLVFEMKGDVSVVAPGAWFSPLTSAMVSESANIYWDQKSSDGTQYNLGYCVLGGGSCPDVGVTGASYQYLAGPGGSAPASILFSDQGPITIDYLTAITAGKNTLGWYDPSNPTVLHQIFSASDGSGTLVTFQPTSIFALYTQNILGETFSTVAAANIGELLTQQHFAFISDPPAQTPEPATWGLIGTGLLVALIRKWASR